MKISKIVILACRVIVGVSIVGVSSFAGWELSQSWAGAFLAFVIVGYQLDIKIVVDDLKSKGKNDDT